MGYGIPLELVLEFVHPQMIVMSHKENSVHQDGFRIFVENKLLHKFELIILFTHRGITLPETNSEFTPENGCLEYDRFLLGQKTCFQGQTVSFREGNHLETRASPNPSPQKKT